nr:hypothetical protein Iba_chr01aCG4890 [Ipomoea batatas]
MSKRVGISDWVIGDGIEAGVMDLNGTNLDTRVVASVPWPGENAAPAGSDCLLRGAVAMIIATGEQSALAVVIKEGAKDDRSTPWLEAKGEHDSYGFVNALKPRVGGEIAMVCTSLVGDGYGGGSDMG